MMLNFKDRTQMTRIKRIFADFYLFISIRENPPDPRLSAFYFLKFKKISQTCLYAYFTGNP